MKITLDHSPIWEIQPDETVTQYRAFCLYRDLGDARSLATLARIWSKSGTEDTSEDLPARGSRGAAVSELAKWSSRNRWVERAAAYTLYLERKFRDERETEIARTNRLHVRMGEAASELVIRRLVGYQDPENPLNRVKALDANEMTAADIARLGKFSVDVTRLAQGQSAIPGKDPFSWTPSEAARVLGDLCDIALYYIPEDCRQLFAEEVRAYVAGERSVRPVRQALSA